MQMRKLFLAALAVVLMSGPAMAEDGQKEGPEGHKMMKNDADTDGDGFLSKAEFLAIQEKRFAEMDGDSDGKVSKDEMKDHFKKMKDKYQEKRKEMAEKMKQKAEEKPAE
ncbi:MAG: hypothetical protein EBQ96_00700 [Proteobacteria bacterium]|nr:hypothetical protein [Pseudomonadota bacterium]